MKPFVHEKLEVYHSSVDFVGLAANLIEEFPPGQSHLANQLHRASISIPLNVAEGAGEFSPGDKARFYRMALRSATECAAILDVCVRLRVADDQNVVAARSVLSRIAAMLTVMAKRFASTTSGSGGGEGEGGGFP